MWWCTQSYPCREWLSWKQKRTHKMQGQHIINLSNKRMPWLKVQIVLLHWFLSYSLWNFMRLPLSNSECFFVLFFRQNVFTFVIRIVAIIRKMISSLLSDIIFKFNHQGSLQYQLLQLQIMDLPWNRVVKMVPVPFQTKGSVTKLIPIFLV